jgi:hypothetical protein
MQLHNPHSTRLLNSLSIHLLSKRKHLLRVALDVEVVTTVGQLLKLGRAAMIAAIHYNSQVVE